MAACTPVSPWIRRWSQATCADGEVTVPTVVPAAGPAGVTYALDPPGPFDRARRRSPVMVTATLADGLAWGTLPAAWTRSTPTTATFTVTLIGGVV